MNKPSITVGYSTIRGFSVSINQTNDDTWTKDVLEIAEFSTREEAEAFVDAIKALLKLSKPKKIICTL
jgi:hypothetical protein